MAKPIEVTDKTFEEVVLNAELPTAVDFWAVWCGPCKMMNGPLEEIAAENAGKLSIAKLNVDENPATATKFDVLSIPTLLVFSNGEVAKKLVGAMPKKRLLDELAAWI